MSTRVLIERAALVRDGDQVLAQRAALDHQGRGALWRLQRALGCRCLPDGLPMASRCPTTYHLSPSQ